ncbi:hypothetical protein [Chryseobacterium sp. VD8]|uniref:hypothetical protein n=1 Tax=Chryseobacterium sp. VD8 TaxID=3081254 RepID=UPI00301A7835
MSDYFRQNSSLLSFSNSDSWVILSPIEQQIKEKIEKIGTPLKDWDIRINYGIKTGFNDAFIIDGAKRKELIDQDPKSEEIIRPILRGRDIKRYAYESSDLWLINTHNGIKEKGIKPIDINVYPAIKNYLDKFYPQLEKRTDKGDTPYNLRNCAYMEDFYKPKLLWAETMRIHKDQTQKFPRFGYDPLGKYLTDKTCFFATGRHLDFILLILNSAIGKYLCYQYVSILDDGGFLMQKIYIEKIPIPKIENIYNEKVVSYINNFQNLNLEDEINSFVFQLYGLNDEEIRFIVDL